MLAAAKLTEHCLARCFVFTVFIRSPSRSDLRTTRRLTDTESTNGTTMTMASTTTTEKRNNHDHQRSVHFRRACTTIRFSSLWNMIDPGNSGGRKETPRFLRTAQALFRSSPDQDVSKYRTFTKTFENFKNINIEGNVYDITRAFRRNFGQVRNGFENLLARASFWERFLRSNPPQGNPCTDLLESHFDS